MENSNLSNSNGNTFYKPYLEESLIAVAYRVNEYASRAQTAIEEEQLYHTEYGEERLRLTISTGHIDNLRAWDFFDDNKTLHRVSAVRISFDIQNQHLENYPYWMAIGRKIVEEFLKKNPSLPTPAWLSAETGKGE